MKKTEEKFSLQDKNRRRIKRNKVSSMCFFPPLSLSLLIVTAMNFMFVFFLANHKLFITVREKIYHQFDKNMGTTTSEMVSRCLNKDTSCIECKMASIMLTLTNCGRMCLEINSQSLYTHRART